MCEQVLRHVWVGAGDPNDAVRVAQLAQRLAPQIDPDGAQVKQALKDATAGAVARGVFGVPTFAVGDRLFWGVDSLEMLADCLRGDAWFDGPAWDEASIAPPGVQRRDAV